MSSESDLVTILREGVGICGSVRQRQEDPGTLPGERGCRFLSDDIAPTRMTAKEVLPFPQTRRRRIHRRRELPPDAIALMNRKIVAIDRDQIRRGAVEIGAVVIPVYASGATAELNRVPPADAAFKLRDRTNFVDHKAAAVSRAVEMARTIPIYKLVYCDGPAAVSVLESLR